MEAKQSLRYPLKKITDSDDYLKIDIIEYKPPGIGNQPGSFALNTSDQTYANIGVKDIQDTIILPIPDNLQDSNSVSWGSAAINPLAAAGIAGVSGAITDPKGVVGKILSGIKNVAGATQTGIGQDLITSVLSGAAVKIAGVGANVDTSTIISRNTGLVANQNLELLFSGVSIRSEFVFAYDLTPRSQNESEVVKKIIRRFKYHSAASKGSAKAPGAGLFLKTPNVFKITYMSGNREHPFLNRFKICALIGMSVDYAASGTYATYPDATPTHMRMGLTFKELTPIYREDYESGIGRDGVGY